jgi:L-lysine exporter family protein LysE/ArgO
MTSVAGLAALATGLVFGLSLIVAVGPQNLFVLQQGVRREHVGLVVAICSSADVALIAAGVGGLGLAIAQHHWPLDMARLGGASFIFLSAALAAHRAFQARTAPHMAASTAGSRAAVVGASVAFTLLNPGVYLDTVVLVGSIANTDQGRQWWFGAGAAVASVLWFAGLGFGARLLAPVFSTARAWWWLDVFTAAVLAAVGCRLLVSA